MGVSFNQVTIAGNLTREPELRYTPGGTAVSDIGLAINEREKKGDAYVDTVVWVDVTLWGRTAEVCNEYCSKGSPVLVSGRLRLDQWEKDGAKHSKLKVVGERLQLLGSKGERSAPRGPDPTLAEFATSGVEDEPPF